MAVAFDTEQTAVVADLLIRELRNLEGAQYAAALDTLQLKRDRDAAKTAILLDHDDPKSLGGNEAQRAARIQQIYETDCNGTEIDQQIRDLEAGTALRTIDIEYTRRKLALEMAVLRAGGTQ